MTGEHAGERRAGELRALVGIEDVRLALASESILQRLDQNAASIVIETRHDSTRRVAQSRTTARYTKPRAVGI
ncbi:hypothetical protein XH81_04570 [Bradyrhizobium sp. CCBAU 25360]|nr:hypothetical protein [Bradyrhizobium sp. CCBAU 25360]